jgi:hypothetical protein
VNLKNIREEIRRLIKDVSEDPGLQRWSDAVILSRINAIQEEVSAFTNMLETSLDINAVSGQSEYPFTSVILAVKKAYWKDDNGTYIPLEKKTTTELDIIDKEWRDTNGTPSVYYIRDNYIGLYPNPDVTRTAGLRIEVAERPTDLAIDADIPFNSIYQFYPFHQGICFGVARLCMFDEGKFNEASQFETRHYNVIKEIQKQISSENIDVRIPNVYESLRSSPLKTR